MRENICYIVGAGSFDNQPFDVKKNDLIIAADGGYKYLKQLNIDCDILLGDFDSIDEIPNHSNIIQHPEQKDDTDMVLAVQTGLKKGYKCFVIYGGLGGRLDHTIANIQTIAYLSKQGAQGFLIGEGMVITAITNSDFNFDGTKRGVISIFANGDKASGVYLNGLKYKLENATITSDYPIGVSNEFVGEESQVIVNNGTLIIVWNDKNFNID
ncbi:MAG: thiamine diphosphokinase [Acutalibacteraceae bacterium]|jgi:thiamine pyrophosphokinase|nr:thiamine diphosphokinase [Clostridiales bacterium]